MCADEPFYTKPLYPKLQLPVFRFDYSERKILLKNGCKILSANSCCSSHCFLRDFHNKNFIDTFWLALTGLLVLSPFIGYVDIRHNPLHCCIASDSLLFDWSWRKDAWRPPCVVRRASERPFSLFLLGLCFVPDNVASWACAPSMFSVLFCLRHLNVYSPRWRTLVFSCVRMANGRTTTPRIRRVVNVVLWISWVSAGIGGARSKSFSFFCLEFTQLLQFWVLLWMIREHGTSDRTAVDCEEVQGSEMNSYDGDINWCSALD